MVTSKSFFVEHIVRMMGAEKPLRILDLGSGSSQNVINALRKYPHVSYVGVEPSASAAKKAIESLKEFPNAVVHNQLGYADIPGAALESFDIVMSLSVLEHVKHLDSFIATSVSYAKKGGLIVHRYDLGHSLAPSSPKESFQVFLGAHFPWVLSEHNFVRYVPESEVRASLERAGISHCEPSTYHQMPSHKVFEKVAKDPRFDELKEHLFLWEFDASEEIRDLPLESREALFPSVAVWARK